MTSNYGDDWGSSDYRPRGSGTPGLWLGLSIAATICCCWPFAIPGIVFSAMAMNDADKDGYEYESHLSKAKGWTIASIVCGVVIYVVLILVRLSSNSGGGTY